MKNIIEICFQKWEPINRMEYFIANIFIIVICFLWVYLFPITLVSMKLSMPGIFYIVVPMLLFYSYTALLITWKRGKDFCKGNFWTYIFFAVIIIWAWSPLIALINPLIMFHPVVFILGIVVNIVWIIMWLVFQFRKTSK